MLSLNLKDSNIFKCNMEQNQSHKLLPNLKVSIGNLSEPDNQIEEGEIPDAIDNGQNILENKVDVVRTWMNTLKTPKTYENKDGAFITGLDLSSDILGQKLQQRAERFGLEKKTPITQNEIDILYKSLGLLPGNLTSCKMKNVRLDALHMRGVEDMNTQDIFAYFKDYGAASIEWINDCSCNVVWLDNATTARALIGVSRPFRVKKIGVTKEKETDAETKGAEFKSSDADAILSDSKDSDKKELDETFENPMEIDSPMNTEKPAELMDEIDIPVPPGHWRIGMNHIKSKAILLRFATKDDKKLPGAEKRSNFYQKYGNPNYGGLKGHITSSKKRKWQHNQNRKVIENFSEDSTLQLKINAGESTKKSSFEQTKRIRMRMYADDEEEKNKKGSFVNLSNRRSVHSRLGNKYTKGDLLKIGQKLSSDESSEESNVPINCTIPSRYKLWNSMAKSMAMEEKINSQRPYSSEIASENCYSFLCDEDSGESSTDSTQGSRPWRASQNKCSDIFQSPLRKFDNDLRSKIQIKKGGVWKHRSPMFLDE